MQEVSEKAVNSIFTRLTAQEGFTEFNRRESLKSHKRLCFAVLIHRFML
jgi:hypothetical protein